MICFRSPNAPVRLSFLALLSLLYRSYTDTAYILPGDYSGFGTYFSFFWFLGYTAIVGGGIWALVVAEKGSRAGLITLLLYSAVIALGFGAISLLVYISYPVEIYVYGANLVFGTIAFISIFLRLWDDR